MAQTVIKGNFERFDASEFKVGLVAAQFNKDITEGLLESAIGILDQYAVPKSSIAIYRVAGSIEIPVILQSLAKTKQYDCLLAIGAVIRGQTPHFDYVAKIVSEGVLRVMLDNSIPVGFGVLTCDNHEQARARIHVGGEAAEAALQSAKLIDERG
ncbi:MAG: 6,7-dimethyl-8-ribityllumazine synthase [Candidatus Doudnabacteria bacterium]|nr:6,7-dimethyl-8-ribityllumazine synthase [Candidatus Doudnabacteria bacterium]